MTAVFGTDWQVNVSAGCTRYFGSYITDGERVSVGPLDRSMTYGESPEGLMDQENGYLMALEEATFYQIRENDLTLYDKYRTPCVRYMPAP